MVKGDLVKYLIVKQNVVKLFSSITGPDLGLDLVQGLGPAVAAIAHAHAVVVTVGKYAGEIFCSPKWGCAGLKVFRHLHEKYKCFTQQQTERGFVAFAPFVSRRIVCGMTEFINLCIAL